MTSDEILAYNAGVSAVLALALRCSQSLEPKIIEKPTRLNFAVGALTALADEGRALFISVPPSPGETDPFAGAPAPTPRPRTGALAVPS